MEIVLISLNKTIMNKKEEVVQLMYMDKAKTQLTIDLTKFNLTADQLIGSIQKKVVSTYKYQMKLENEESDKYYNKLKIDFFKFLAKELNLTLGSCVEMLKRMHNIDNLNTYKFLVKQGSKWLYKDVPDFKKQSVAFFINIKTNQVMMLPRIDSKLEVYTEFLTREDAELIINICKDYQVVSK